MSGRVCLGGCCRLLAEAVDVRDTGEPRRMLVVSCRPVDVSVTREQVRPELQRVWLERLRYCCHEAHHLRIEPDAGIRYFIIQTDSEAFDVTGSLYRCFPWPVSTSIAPSHRRRWR